MTAISIFSSGGGWLGSELLEKNSASSVSLKLKRRGKAVSLLHAVCSADGMLRSPSVGCFSPFCHARELLLKVLEQAFPNCVLGMG